MFKVGNRVKYADADEGIPAYRDMRGTVVEVLENGKIKVHWNCDAGPEWGYRNPWNLVLAED